MTPTGMLSSTPPSTRTSPSTVRIGGKTPGIEKLARSPSQAGPVSCTSTSPRVRLVDTQKPLIHESS